MNNFFLIKSLFKIFSNSIVHSSTRMNLLINLPVGRCKIFDKKTNMNFDFFHDYIENKQ